MLRGMMMYYMLHVFGPVPVIVDASKIGVAEEEAYLVRPSLKEFVQYITDDFEHAAANMAEVQKEQGRYTADFARFFLMHRDGYIVNKYNPESSTTQYQGNDVALARWADVLLMYAEADVRLHNSVSNAAVNAVNQVRRRAGIADLSADKTASVSAFMDAILEERGHELWFEGQRKIDLIRFNRYYTTMSALGRTPTSEYIPLPDYAVEQAANSGHTLEQYFTRDNYDGPKK